MPIKTKTKKKSSIIRIVLIALASLAVIALTLFLTKHFLQERSDQQLLSEQKIRLDAAEKDINRVAGDFLGNFSANEIELREVTNKECGESSAKYGRGTISCRSSTFARILTSQDDLRIASYELQLEKLLRETDSFTSIKEPYIKELSEDSNRVFEIRSNYIGSQATDCHFTVDTYTQAQYQRISRDIDIPTGAKVVLVSMGCREITKEPIYPLRD